MRPDARGPGPGAAALRRAARQEARREERRRPRPLTTPFVNTTVPVGAVRDAVRACRAGRDERLVGFGTLEPVPSGGSQVMGAALAATPGVGPALHLIGAIWATRGRRVAVLTTRRLVLCAPVPRIVRGGPPGRGGRQGQRGRTGRDTPEGRAARRSRDGGRRAVLVALPVEVLGLAEFVAAGVGVRRGRPLRARDLRAPGGRAPGGGVPGGGVQGEGGGLRAALGPAGLVLDDDELARAAAAGAVESVVFDLQVTERPPRRYLLRLGRAGGAWRLAAGLGLLGG